MNEQLEQAWIDLDRQHEVEDAKWRKAPWARPNPTPARIPESWRWWHRIRGHHTRSRYDLIAPPYAWQCLECDITIGHY